MLFTLVALSTLQFVASLQHWCGYQPSWRLEEDDRGTPVSNDKTLTYLAYKEGEYGNRLYNYNLPFENSSINALNHETGIFTNPEVNYLHIYKITLTALLNNLGHLAVESKGSLSSYAQLFILTNGVLYSLDHYLLVEQGKIGELRMEVEMSPGDTLEVFVGHHVNDKTMYDRYNGRLTTVQGFNLEQIRFCVWE